MVTVDLLYVPDCPNLDLARRRLAEAAARVGVEMLVRDVLVADAASAADLGLRGSPTILINGRDVADGSGMEPSLSCRLYATTAGIEGSPSVDELVTALSR